MKNLDIDFALDAVQGSIASVYTGSVAYDALFETNIIERFATEMVSVGIALCLWTAYSLIKDLKGGQYGNA